jgi:hypothetical protein
MKRQTRDNKSTAATDELTQLIVVYDKVCQTMLSCPLDVDIVDIYTLYDFASLLVLFASTQNESYSTTSTNATRLFQACSDVRDAPACFFDCDKLYYDRTEITRAITSVGCTEVQQELLLRIITRLFESFESETLTGTGFSTSDARSEVPYNDSKSQDGSVQGTLV